MNTIVHKELIERKRKLQQITVSLKEHFIGLDGVIDEVISLMMPWYLFPEAQLRPTIINLWGLTGSGKTALIQMLVELLDYKKFYTHMDMGEFESSSASWIRNILTDDLEFFHERPVIICLDEFQFAKTLDENKKELGKDKLRVVWELLDSGQLNYIPRHNTYYLFRAEKCLMRLDNLIKCGGTMQQGEVAEGLELFLKIFDGFYFEDSERYNEAIGKAYFLSNDFLEGLTGLCNNDDFTKAMIKDKVMSFSLEELKHFILEALRVKPATKQLDLSHSIIFVLGNLDEAYTMSGSMNPDISADEFHEETSKITIANIKRALRKRFRPEQIARLGNNHVLYKSFNNDQFRQLIGRELTTITAFVFQKFGWVVNFDPSVVDVVYAEGVFPAQGTRPVFTTIKNLIESRITKLVVSVLEEDIDVKEIAWAFEQGKFIYQIKNKSNEIVKTIAEEISLKLESLRKSIDPEIQAHTAVHEAGHAVLAALTLRIIPSLVVSRTASDSAEGFCQISFPKGPMTKETLKKDIIISLGGYVAEKMIFGAEFTCSGVYMDIEEASALANKAVRKYAMGSDPIHLAVKSTQNENSFFETETYAEESMALIRACEIEATDILKRNKLLLLKMADYLTSHSRMEESLIGEFVQEYSIEEWVSKEGFIKKEDYYRFNTMIQHQLKELEENVEDIVINDLFVNEFVRQ